MRVEAERRDGAGDPVRRRHRPRDPAGGPRAGLRPLLPRDDGPPGGCRDGPRARDRRRARRALGRGRPPPRRPRNPRRSRVPAGAYRTLTIALPSLGSALASVAAWRRSASSRRRRSASPSRPGLGLAVYLASGSSLAPPVATARVPTGTIGRPSLPPLATTMGETTTDETTTDETKTETDERRLVRQGDGRQWRRRRRQGSGSRPRTRRRRLTRLRGPLASFG